MNDEEKIYLALGSNINDKYNNLKNCLYLLDEHPHIWITNKSHIYQSPPMYNIEQEDYYNMVIEIETNLIPIDLLNQLQKIEIKLGRENKREKNMPRIIDIDILTCADIEINTDILKIPHPKIYDRKFVLKPWNDIAPKFKVPGQNALVSEILENTDDNSDVRMVLIVDKEGML